MNLPRCLLLSVTIACGAILSVQAAPIKVLIVDGQNNHNWKATTPLLRTILESSGLFRVDVATSPPQGGDMSSFQPEFSTYRGVVSNYNGDLWSADTRKAFEIYVKNGGGFVSVHAADNAFPEWEAYNEMIGVGGWGGRDEQSGPRLYWEDGEVVRDTSPGRGGSHGQQHVFLMTTRDADHPIMKGLPEEWLHAQDELYDRLRGPALNLTVLATAFSDPKTKGTGNHEPLLLAIQYGKGRVFHTALGHDVAAMRCQGFATTLQRGTEWVITGDVTLPVPANFPTAKEVRSW